MAPSPCFDSVDGVVDELLTLASQDAPSSDVQPLLSDDFVVDEAKYQQFRERLNHAGFDAVKYTTTDVITDYYSVDFYVSQYEPFEHINVKVQSGCYVLPWGTHPESTDFPTPATTGTPTS
ncbi:hypothetical protein ON058_00485 [Demequina sp. B12]|nr:hypothetical protein [Demequina sp. B12]